MEMEYVSRNDLQTFSKEDRKKIFSLQRQYILLEQQFVVEKNNGERAIMWEKLTRISNKRAKLMQQLKDKYK